MMWSVGECLMLQFNQPGVTRFSGCSPFQRTVIHEKIRENRSGQKVIPAHVRIPYIEGDGIGPEIMLQAQRVTNKAVELTYQNQRSIAWIPLLAGKKALAAGKPVFPQETLDAIRSHHVAVKSPMDTPIGGGFRSVNVQLRKALDLYMCIRPLRTFPGVRSPLEAVNNQSKTVNMTVFRENTEDIYKGIEFAKGHPITRALILLLNKLGNFDIRPDSALAVKPISETASKRIVEKAIEFALKQGKPSVTLVHKGNIMKETEGAFLKWGEAVAREKFSRHLITQDEFWKTYQGDFSKVPKGKFVLQSKIADAMFQEVTLKPDRHHVVVTMNLNGDYLSDDIAATVGGLGLSPGANIGDHYAVFEATHGSAPDIAGQNKANPTALILSMAMMLNHLGWTPAAQLMYNAVEMTLANGHLTGDLQPARGNYQPLSTTDYTEKLVDTMEHLHQEQLKTGTPGNAEDS